MASESSSEEYDDVMTVREQVKARQRQTPLPRSPRPRSRTESDDFTSSTHSLREHRGKPPPPIKPKPIFLQPLPPEPPMTAEEAKSNQTPSQPSHVKPFPLPKPDRLTDMEQSLKGPKKSGTYSPVKKRTSTGVYPSRPVSALVKGTRPDDNQPYSPVSAMPPRTRTIITSRPLPPPPEPLSSVSKPSVHSTTSSRILGGSQTSTPPSPLTLQQLADLYSTQFPIRVRILQGYRSETSHIYLSKSEVYDVHCLQHRKVVSIRDSKGRIHSVPLDCPAQFGITYTPTHSETSSFKGKKPNHSKKPQSFRSISDIIANEKSLPTVVCATKPYQGLDSQSSVNEGEVLVVVGVNETRVPGKRTLQVLSLSSKENKYLPPECKGNFTTEPHQVCLLLTDIVVSISNPFPCQAVVFLDSEFESSKQYVPESLLTGTVTMIESKVEASLSLSAEVAPGSSAPAHLDIPLDDSTSGVKVAVVRTDDGEGLHNKTSPLRETHNPSSLKSGQDSKSTQISSYQSALSSKREARNSTLQLGSRNIVEQGLSHDCHETPFNPDYPNSDSEEYVQMTSPPLSTSPYEQEWHLKPGSAMNTRRDGNTPSHPTVSHKQALAHVHPVQESARTPGTDRGPSTASRDLKGSKASPTPLSTSPPSAGRYVSASSPLSSNELPVLKGEEARSCAGSPQISTTSSLSEYHYIATQSTADHSQGYKDGDEKAVILNVLGELRNAIEALSERVDALESHVYDKHSAAVSSSKKAENRSYLKTLSADKVQVLLESMDLGQYTSVFTKENVTGNDLAYLDDDDLENVLGICNRLHRIRLMKIISGQSSPNV